MIIKKHLKEYFEDWEFEQIDKEQFEETITQIDEKFEGIYKIIEILQSNKESADQMIDDLEEVIDNGVEDDNKKDA
jgi:molecular chaperone DnaK (HSP70)